MKRPRLRPRHGIMHTCTAAHFVDLSIRFLSAVGAVRQVLPICLEVTTPDLHYVRVHRRHGTTDRSVGAKPLDGAGGQVPLQLWLKLTTSVSRPPRACSKKLRESHHHSIRQAAPA